MAKKIWKAQVVRERQSVFGDSKRRKLDAAGFGEEKGKGSTTTRLGEFENHTKGFGQKMLEILGYKGGGLGKHGQGIVTPIEPMIRPKNMGIGFHEIPQSHYKDDDDESVLPNQGQGHGNGRTKKLVSKKKVYVTTTAKEEVVVEKIIDMRGPEVRILTNLANLNDDDDDVSMPELRHNIQMILDTVGQHMQKLGNDLRNERETVFALQNQKEKLHKEALHQQHQIQNLEMMTMMDQLDVQGMEVAPPPAHAGWTEQNYDEIIQAEEDGMMMMMTLKEVIEIYAQENGLVFKPKPGRMHDGFQIYGFGNLSIILDNFNQKVFAHIQDRWSLVCLHQLLRLHLQNQS